MKMTQENCTSKILFELHNAKEYLISDDLQKFLCSMDYPWQLLGAPLVKFVEQCVAKVLPGERMQGQISSNAYIENPDKVVISEGAVIEPGAYITGSVFIEPHVVIRHGAYLRGPVYVSQYAIVGHATECKGSIFLPHAKAAHMNYVGDSENTEIS
jgi:NDP-sugar pyrophosphorylase family protein